MDGAWEKYFGLLGTGSYVKIRWESGGKGHFGWGPHIFKEIGWDLGKKEYFENFEEK